MPKQIALRMDDVGASSKQFEQYSKKLGGIGNILFLKHLPYFKAWGPYPELNQAQWDDILSTLSEHHAKLTVSITASWVDYDGTLTSFPKKFPEQAKRIKKGYQEGLLEIANHGLTHCVLKHNAFRPRLFRSNRTFHREFHPWIPASTHDTHIKTAQAILQDYFETPIVTLVPPGNVFSEDTVTAAKNHGVRYINCQTQSRVENGMIIRGNEDIVAFHDKEIVEIPHFLSNLIMKLKKTPTEFKFITELMH